jgi:hypothetical protein
VSHCYLIPSVQFFDYYDEKKIGWDDDNVDIPFVLDEHA